MLLTQEENCTFVADSFNGWSVSWPTLSPFGILPLHASNKCSQNHPALYTLGSVLVIENSRITKLMCILPHDSFKCFLNSGSYRQFKKTGKAEVIITTLNINNGSFEWNDHWSSTHWSSFLKVPHLNKMLYNILWITAVIMTYKTIN